MENTVSFIYTPYIHFEAYKFVLQNLRKYYPKSNVFIHFDSIRTDTEKYKDIAISNGCQFILRENTVFYTDKNDPFEINLKKMVEITNRLKYFCENSDSKWMLIIEDDVLIKRQIKNFPTADIGTARSYNRPGGGSIFKRQIYLDCLKKVDILDIIKNVPEANWAADVVLEHIFKRNNATFEEWQELAEPQLRDNQDHSIFHGYKDLYNKK